ncbi:hypothetical protein B0H21DRAFT_818273 [Amylocystis lapponica]|nr:hypothetical protein B0H21DRAFT_818273 [Amylocystis lapponica]
MAMYRRDDVSYVDLRISSVLVAVMSSGVFGGGGGDGGDAASSTDSDDNDPLGIGGIVSGVAQAGQGVTSAIGQAGQGLTSAIGQAGQALTSDLGQAGGVLTSALSPILPGLSSSSANSSSAPTPSAPTPTPTPSPNPSLLDSGATTSKTTTFITSPASSTGTAGASKSFLQNTPVAASVITLASLIGLILLILIGTWVVRKRNNRRLHQEAVDFSADFSAQDLTGAHDIEKRSAGGFNPRLSRGSASNESAYGGVQSAYSQSTAAQSREMYERTGYPALPVFIPGQAQDRYNTSGYPGQGYSDPAYNYNGPAQQYLPNPFEPAYQPNVPQQPYDPYQYSVSASRSLQRKQVPPVDTSAVPPPNQFTSEPHSATSSVSLAASPMQPAAAENPAMPPAYDHPELPYLSEKQSSLNKPAPSASSGAALGQGMTLQQARTRESWTIRCPFCL